MSTPLHAQPPARRRRIARELVGREVVAVIDRTRTGAQVYELVGTVVSVAMPSVGTVADLLILRREGFWDAAVSLASVVSLEALS